MHHVLQIHEVLLNIFGHCCPRTSFLDADSATGTSSLAALARTCRAFKEPALDVLWEDLDNLSPLVRCISEAAHQISSKWCFSKLLTTTEWRILQSYARRVRYLWNVELSVSKESVRVLLNPPSTESLFPNLRHLRSTAPEVIPLSDIPLPSLTFLYLDFRNSHIFRDCLESFPKLCPNLRHLTLSVNGRRVEGLLNKFESNYFRLWPNLHTVTCYRIALDLDALVHLSRMPSLTQLAFTLSTPLSASDSFSCFSNLGYLCLYAESLDLIPGLLFQIRLPVATDLFVDILSCPSRQDLFSFIASVQACAAVPTLEGLELNQSSAHNDLDDDRVLGFGDLRPWMAFSSLHYVHVNIDWDVNLTDNDLLELASSWPHLEELSINSHWGWNTHGGITPNGLSQLLLTCRSLTIVALAIDTREYTEFHPIPENPELKLSPGFSIDVIDSIIKQESVPAVAAFLASIMPHDEFSFSVWTENNFPAQFWKPYTERWYDVCEQAREAVRQRVGSLGDNGV